MLLSIKKKFNYLLEVVKVIKDSVWRTVAFTITLFLYLTASLFGFCIKYLVFSKEKKDNWLNSITIYFEKIAALIESGEKVSIRRTQLIDLSIRNMKMRKARTIITIGGMTVGIGAIVFLVSIGYGLQDLVISRVAKLDEMKQTTVMIQSGSRMPLNGETVASFREVANVETVLPVISVVGRVNFNDSISDIAVYGVTSEYLKKTDIKTTSGEIFNNDELTKVFSYHEENNETIKKADPVPLAQEDVINDKSIAEIDGLKHNAKGELIMSDENQTGVATRKIALEGAVKKEAVVNQAMLQVLGIQEKDAIDEIFITSFVVVGNLLDGNKEKIESVPEQYRIVGVIPEGKTPLFYVPFINLRSLGIINYSQVKVAVSEPEFLAKARKQIEAMGYRSHSVADTVDQINNLFSTARLFLALVGMVALSVAALGMFNTLTVSLLERTREVGLMKAMGMKSAEVHELFLTESMIMGFLGGVLGILLGFVAGKLAGIILSFFSVIKGVGTVSVSSIPILLVLIIISLSLFVGIVTGIYPAKRAEKISALNALRYE